MDNHHETKSQSKTKTNVATTDRVMVTYYTDPLCCWSWALEQHWKRLRIEFREQIKWRYIMGGMIPDWKSYNDPLNAINKPIQFGPIWMHASQVSGATMDYSIWHTDPPTSSYPSCIAVKCAQLQSPQAGELLLYDLREAVMTGGKNISRQAVIFSVAEALHKKRPELFSYEAFLASWNNDSGSNAFLSDLQQVRFLKIGRFPTLTFTNGGATGTMITGYRPYEALEEALMQILTQSEAINKK